MATEDFGFDGLDDYEFPQDRLSTLTNSDKTPVVLVACGSFSPITYAHLRMFEMALDYCRQNTDFEVVGGYLSPVSDSYKKQGLLSSRRRVEMCQLACSHTSSWIMVDHWEAYQKEYQRTAVVLDHFDECINDVLGGVLTKDGTRKRARIMLLAGFDLIQTMSEPGVWSRDDLAHILGRYGAFAVERSGSDVDVALESLSTWRDNIYVIQQMIHNDVSSTKIRLFLKRGMSVHYLLPAPVVEYILANGLYKDDGRPNTAEAASGSSSPSGKSLASTSGSSS